MSREEAIEVIKAYKDKLTNSASNQLDGDIETFDMAIKALEQEPGGHLISRADAEALFRNARSKLNPSDYKTADEFNTRDLMLLNAEQFIHLLPSVNPQEPCDDAISRQAVLEQTYLWSKDEFLRVTNPFDYLHKKIMDLPPVNPQRNIVNNNTMNITL